MAVFANIWGLYNSANELVFDVDTVIDLKYENASKISMFPVEAGSFATYNKVRNPYKAKVRMAVGGDQIRVANFIAALDAAANDTNLYSIVTPESVYVNANIEKISYSRSHDKGVNNILADLEIVEVRQVAPQYSNVSIIRASKKPSAQSKVDTGKNQVKVPPKDLANVDAVTAFKQGMRREEGGA